MMFNEKYNTEFTISNFNPQQGTVNSFKWLFEKKRKDIYI